MGRILCFGNCPLSLVCCLFCPFNPFLATLPEDKRPQGTAIPTGCFFTHVLSSSLELDDRAGKGQSNRTCPNLYGRCPKMSTRRESHTFAFIFPNVYRITHAQVSEGQRLTPGVFMSTQFSWKCYRSSLLFFSQVQDIFPAFLQFWLSKMASHWSINQALLLSFLRSASFY